MTNISLFDFEPSKTTSRARFFEEIEPHLPILVSALRLLSGVDCDYQAYLLP